MIFMTYEEQGDVILESQGSVVFVDSDASDATVLFETAVGPQAVLTGDDTKIGHIDSVNKLNVNNQALLFSDLNVIKCLKIYTKNKVTTVTRGRNGQHQ